MKIFLSKKKLIVVKRNASYYLSMLFVRTMYTKTEKWDLIRPVGHLSSEAIKIYKIACN
jgi:hypothetical protein